MGDLSQHFSKFEFRCPHCGRLPDGGISQKLLAKLENLRAFLGKPITVNSGYRCPYYNKLKGGVQDSQHTKGRAADIRVVGVSVHDLAWQAARIFGWVSGVGIYPAGHGKFVHVDVRNWHARWPRAEWKNLKPPK